VIVTRLGSAEIGSTVERAVDVLLANVAAKEEDDVEESVSEVTEMAATTVALEDAVEVSTTAAEEELE
jgi:hypothetical protein